MCIRDRSDDVSLDVGTLRVRAKGSAGGQNGLKNIIYHLNSEDFPRVKIGVGKKPRPDYDLAAWVLGKFPAEDQDVYKRQVVIRRDVDTYDTVNVHDWVENDDTLGSSMAY